MKETFILAPGADPAELLRTMAHHGYRALNVRITGSAELAKTALSRGGIATAEKYISVREQSAIYYDIIPKIYYFGTASFSDAQKLAYAIDSLRRLIPHDERQVLSERLPYGEFSEKNEAVLNAYLLYTERLCQENKTDTIALVRRAISEAPVMDSAEFIALNEFPLSPLDKALLEKLSGGQYRQTTLRELLGKSAASVRVERYTDAFGETNEIESILGTIIANKIPFDRCVIAVADIMNYGQFIYDACLAYGIPVTFGCGIPIANSRPAQMLRLLGEWSGAGQYGADALTKLVYSQVFNRSRLKKNIGCEHLRDVLKIAGYLRLSTDSASNADRLGAFKTVAKNDAVIKPLVKDAHVKDTIGNIIAAAEKLAAELEKGTAYIIGQYLRWDLTGHLDTSAYRLICQTIEAYPGDNAEKDFKLDEIISGITQKTVCCENSAAGSLYVTGINGALSTYRENLFVAGMNAGNFPGTPRENYLTLDSDLLMFADDQTAPTSENTVLRRSAAFDSMINNACALGSSVFVSYSSFDCAELKRSNPSSALFGLFRKEFGEDATLSDFFKCGKYTQAGFFEQDLRADRLIGIEYRKRTKIIASPTAPTEKRGQYAFETALDTEYSPTSIESYINCPKRFYLKYIAGLYEPDDADDPYKVIGAAAKGTLAHDLMESLAAQPDIPEERFKAAAGELFDSYLRLHIPLNGFFADMEKKRFINMMLNAYRTDPRATVLAAEENMSCGHSSGIRLSGIPDRIERRSDGSCVIVDYKTGNKIKQKEKYPLTYVQTLLYAIIAKQQKEYYISECQYRYIAKNEVKTRIFDKDSEDAVSGLLDTLSSAIRKNDFDIKADSDSCKYCGYSDICGKHEAKEDEENAG